jgi:protein-S-isoprenylcysteine O-methyltransferase Ste14
LIEQPDRANAIVRPPIALALAFAAGLAFDRFFPAPWMPVNLPNRWIGAAVFALGFALLVWSAVTFRRAGTQVQGTEPTTAIVGDGPYRFSRNPIYLGMFLGLAGLAAGFNSLWILAALVPFYFVLRYGVVAREEAYLERKFGGVYTGYKSRVRRWL